MAERKDRFLLQIPLVHTRGALILRHTYLIQKTEEKAYFPPYSLMPMLNLEASTLSRQSLHRKLTKKSSSPYLVELCIKLFREEAFRAY